MAQEYEFEFKPPSISTCDDCNGLTVRLTRFVHRNEQAYAVYYAKYSNNHPDNSVDMLISLGPWGETALPSQRVAFLCHVRAIPGTYQVMLADADDESNPWQDAEILGKMLSAAAARRHEWKKQAFELLDAAFEEDPSLRGFLQRVNCDSVGVPLEKSFRFPDDVFALSEEARAVKGHLSDDLISLDEKRFFIRTVLPIRAQGYNSWNIGFWVEVSRQDYARARKIWGDEDLYPSLCVSGTLANAFEVPALSFTLGEPVTVRVTDPSGVPRISIQDESKAALVETEWGKAAFEQYAAEKGYL